MPEVVVRSSPIREEIERLQRLGPMPADESAEATQDRIDEYNHLVESLRKPISDDEARVLVNRLQAIKPNVAKNFHRAGMSV